MRSQLCSGKKVFKKSGKNTQLLRHTDMKTKQSNRNYISVIFPTWGGNKILLTSLNHHQDTS